MTASDGLYAVVEIMGRRTRAGMISDTQLGGATLLRIEHPTQTDHTGSEPLCEYYAPSAIFAIRPSSREDAETVAGWAWPEPRTTPALGPAFDHYVDDDDEDIDDAELEREPF